MTKRISKKEKEKKIQELITELRIMSKPYKYRVPGQKTKVESNEIRQFKFILHDRSIEKLARLCYFFGQREVDLVLNSAISSAYSHWLNPQIMSDIGIE